MYYRFVLVLHLFYEVFHIFGWVSDAVLDNFSVPKMHHRNDKITMSELRSVTQVILLPEME